MSFTDRTTSVIIGDGEFLAGNLVYLDEETSPQSEGWDMKTERWAIRRALVTAEDAVEFFPTGSQRGETPWWVQSARPQRIAPGVWEIIVSLKGWAGVKPKHFRGGVNDGEVVAIETDEYGNAIKWGYGSRIYVQYVVASHEEIDTVREGILEDLNGPEMASAFPVSGVALAKYETARAEWQIAYDAWYAAPARTAHLVWQAAVAEWEAARPGYLSLLEVYNNEVSEWQTAWNAWDAGRPAEVRAQEAWDAADAAFDIRHSQWAASAAWNIPTAQVVRSGPVYFVEATAGYIEQPTCSEACTATVSVRYTSGGSPAQIDVTAAITAGMTRQAAATAIAAAINANGTLGALLTAAAVLPYGSTFGTSEPRCVELTRDATADNDSNLSISFIGDNGLLGIYRRVWIRNYTASTTVVFGIGTAVAEPVWTGGTRPAVTTPEVAAPVAPTPPNFPGIPSEPELSAPPVEPVFPTAIYGLADSQTERLTGSPATLVTDTIKQLII